MSVVKILFVIRFSQSNKSVKTLNFTVKERLGGVFEALKRGEVFLLAYLTIQKTIRGALSVIKAKKNVEWWKSRCSLDSGSRATEELWLWSKSGFSAEREARQPRRGTAASQYNCLLSTKSKAHFLTFHLGNQNKINLGICQKPTFYPGIAVILIFQKCEFCEKWDFRIVNFVQIGIS